MTILYLHGLKSKLSQEKRKILEKYGEVVSPDIDYSKQYVQPSDILRPFQENQFNVVMGSSMGAMNAFLVAEMIGRPSLLFNPPLGRYDTPEPDFDPNYLMINGFQQIILGGSDEVVDPAITLEALGKYAARHEFFIEILPRLGHRIPKEIFERQVSIFFSKLCY